MNVIPYQEKYKKDFIQFNTDWIVDHFGFLEEEDLHTFEHIEESLQNGAMIYFAVENENVLATCMSKPMDHEGTWELCKLGSNKHLPHKGAGSAVFKAAMDWAVGHGAKKLFILSNSKLKAAVHIYEKYGFHEVKLDDYEYVRGDIAFEYMVPHEAN
jgi:N-acetylglutamate synthase and related acetyltransferases